MQGPSCEQQDAHARTVAEGVGAAQPCGLALSARNQGAASQHYNDETYANLDEADNSARRSRIKSGCIRKWPTTTATKVWIFS